MTHQIKAIIFDMDGVLTDSMPAHALAWQKTFQEIEIKIEPMEIYLIEGSNHSGIVETILKSHNRKYSKEIATELSTRKIQIFNTIYKPNIYNGVKKLLTMLQSKKLKLGVASGSNQTTVHQIINTCFDPGIFNAILTGDDIENGKPAPDIYQKTINKLQLTPEECIVIENAPRGITAAKKAGCTCIAITTTLPPQHLQNADKIVKNHEELYEQLQ
ncbi:HAD family hydrolase [Methanosarcinales archaeon ex4484_138]|nr:MAG: HAD family hydrolase [Methanosarcinales archaeon ex4484_138]